MNKNHLLKIFLLVIILIIIHKKMNGTENMENIYDDKKLISIIENASLSHIKLVDKNKVWNLGLGVNKFTFMGKDRNNPRFKTIFGTYDILTTDILSRKILSLSKNNIKLSNSINQFLINIYGKIKENKNLKKYLLSLNLINMNGLPIHINNTQENLMLNQIKIMLVLLSKEDTEKINKLFKK